MPQAIRGLQEERVRQHPAIMTGSFLARGVVELYL